MIIVRRLMLENYANCLFYDEIMLQPQQRFQSVYRKVNKITLSINDYRRLQHIHTKQSEMLSIYK